MAFGVKKFRVTARVMRTRDGKPTKVSIVPSKSMKRKGEKIQTKKLSEKQKNCKTKKCKEKEAKRKLRAPRS